MRLEKRQRADKDVENLCTLLCTLALTPLLLHLIMRLLFSFVRAGLWF